MKARVIALYLPQFHPIPENDEWWGKGFTEWTNVGRAKPRFKGHYQPKVPADLGYYDLRVPEVRQQQAELARKAGVEGFCYYHYWFGKRKQLLERPFAEVVSSGTPDFPFCVCWANHTWSNKTWEAKSAASKETILIEQCYEGEEDYIDHFYSLLPAFKDKRYMKIDGRLIFVIYDILHFKDVKKFMTVWKGLAEKNGLPGFYFIAMMPSTLAATIDNEGNLKSGLPNLHSSADLYQYALNLGFDAVNSFGKRRGEMLCKGKLSDLFHKFLAMTGISAMTNYDYAKTVSGYFAPEDVWENVFPTILPQWDRTARAGKAEGVYINSSPQKFADHIRHALSFLERKDPEHRILFLKSWNEWAEGNYVEPDLKYGHGFLNALRDAIMD